MDEEQSRNRTTLSDIIYFYKQQLSRFYKIGIGNKTENGVIVTEDLIKITQKRLAEISLVYDAKLKPRTPFFEGQSFIKGKIRKKLHENNSNGTVAKSSSKSDGNNRHGGGKS